MYTISAVVCMSEQSFTKTKKYTLDENQQRQKMDDVNEICTCNNVCY